MAEYCEILKKLIDRIIAKGGVCEDRIYLLGTSLGASCTQKLLYKNRDFFAAGVAVMGALPDIDNEDFDKTRLGHQNLWIAHSADDKNVAIREDDLLYAQLKDINPNLKYTRWKRLGHGMSTFFYLIKPWKSWLFSKRKHSKTE